MTGCTLNVLKILLNHRAYVGYALKFQGREQKPPASNRIPAINQPEQVHKEITQILEHWFRNVSLFIEYLPGYKDYLFMQIDRFIAGCIYNKVSAWENLTSESEILQTGKGMNFRV